ncbi:MAG: LysE family translocator [Pseudomonadota bacterium]|nr:LysE family translocator [Pseudomonadota bacterium]
MEWKVWLGFATASLFMGLIPGPGVASIVGYALGSGRKTALASVGGMALGNVVAMTLSLAGVGALLAASALAFAVLKWAGALYLIGLGLLTVIRARRDASAAGEAKAPISPRAAFASNVAVGTFHPKTIVFFVAFAPQFISAHAAYWPQAAILILTFGAVVATTDTLYALAASRASNFLRRPKTMLWTKRAGGGVLIAAGVATAAAKA